MLVKHLLYTEKFTIDGARQRIDQYRRTGELRASARQAFEAELATEVRAAIEDVVKILDGRADAAARDEHPRHQRRRHPRPGSRPPRRRLPRGGHRHRGGARPGAERHLALAHAPPAAAARAPARRRVADRRHPHRLRHARPAGVDARAARLRLLRRQSRSQHGRGRALFRHRRGRHGGRDARRPGHRDLVRRATSPETLDTYRDRAGPAGAADHERARLSRADAAQHQPARDVRRPRCSASR